MGICCSAQRLGIYVVWVVRLVRLVGQSSSSDSLLRCMLCTFIYISIKQKYESIHFDFDFHRFVTLSTQDSMSANFAQLTFA